MRLLVDVAHPANVHYFKYFIQIMKDKGHETHVTAREKDVTFDLLKAYKIPYYDMGDGTIGSGILGKILYVLWADVLMYKQFKLFKPDVAVSFSSSYVAHICSCFKIPHITFEDTEHAKANRTLYKSWTDLIITPASFYDSLGYRHMRMKSFMELFYLHKNHFSPKPQMLEKYKININKPFVLFRFVSWDAFHDIGEKGIDESDRMRLIEIAKNYGDIYISSESPLPEQLKKYRLNIDFHEIHHILAFAKLYVGEGGTMASECAMLGIPSIYINSLPLMGYLENAQKEGLLYHLNKTESILAKMKTILKNPDSKKRFKNYRDNMLANLIDPNAFLIWLVENYPNSRALLSENPNYQNKFR
jgi:uncharacterized protein